MVSDVGVTVTMSQTVGAIGAALAKAQLAMRPAVRDATNPHFKNRYATLASCVEALRPLHENNIAVIQPPAVQGADGVVVATLLVHSSGEWIRGELYMPASKKDAQGFGSALSYARRYCLTSTVGLATDDDDGEAAVREPPPALERQLAASVEMNTWAAQREYALLDAKTMGALQEEWSDIVAAKPPEQIRKRLGAIKDERKRALSGNGNGAHP